jgi:hypothetical protein
VVRLRVIAAVFLLCAVGNLLAIAVAWRGGRSRSLVPVIGRLAGAIAGLGGAARGEDPDGR